MTDDDQHRRQEAFVRRNRVARQQLLQATYRTDENVDDDPVTTFGKALEHDDVGVPTEAAYGSLVEALEDGSVEAFNDIDLAGDGVPGTDPGDVSRRLVEPNGAFAFQEMGADPTWSRSGHIRRSQAIGRVPRWSSCTGGRCVET